MKTTYEGKRYSSDRCEEIAHRDHYNNGNYAGTTTLLRASNGKYLLLTESNGQDCWVTDQFFVCDDPTEQLETMEMTDEQEKRAVELGLIEEV
jgi:hypothetical protein